MELTVFVIVVLWLAIGIVVAMVLGRLTDLGSRDDVRQTATRDATPTSASSDALDDIRTLP